MAEFGTTIGEAYTFEGGSLDLGRGVHEGKVVEEAAVRLPLATSNRHGLIAGATGTGKTRTLQLLAEQLSAAGVPVVAADIKGDVSGIAQPGEARLDACFRIGGEDIGHVGDHPGGTNREQRLGLLGSDGRPGNELERHEGADTFDHVLHTIATGVPEMDVERYLPPESP